jgi:hydroxyacylglutathione hydrolase
MRLLDGIYLVGSGNSGVSLTHPLDCHVYLLDTGDGLALFDAGLGVHPQLIEKRIEEDGLDTRALRYLFLTHVHADHAGGAAYFKERYDLQVIAPRAEAVYLETGDEESIGLVRAKKAGYYPGDYQFSSCGVDTTIAPGERIGTGDLEITAYSAAGHSVGGVCYLGRTGSGTFLISGDLISHGGYISLQSIPGSDVAAYERSVRMLAGLAVDFFLPGHGLFSLGDGQKQIDLTIAAFDSLFVPNRF